MKKKKAREEGEHEVTITITIAKASLTEVDVDTKHPDQPSVQNYFHCAYKLLPDDKDATKADVVTFGMAAKLYGEHDAKVLRTWVEGSRTWVAWTTTRKIQVTHDVLLRMFKHKVELKVWDTRDKVSAKARFDRPKAFRLPPTKASDEIDLNTVRDLLTTENSQTIHLGAGLSVFSDHKSSPTATTSHADIEIGEKQGILTTPDETGGGRDQRSMVGATAGEHVVGVESNLEVQVRLDENNQPEFKNLLTLASSGKKPLACDVEEEERERAPGKHENDARKKPGGGGKRSKRKSKQEEGETILSQHEEQHAQSIRSSGLACITIPLSALFTDCTQISNDLPGPVSSIEQVVIVLTLDHQLLSSHQRAVLNPMILTIGSAMAMPNRHLPYNMMAERYDLAYIMYKFHDEDVHRSAGRPHARNIRFADRNVVLLGTKRTGPLFEYLRGPRFRIELHDRDICPGAQEMQNSVFGSHAKDENISSAVASGAHPTPHNPFDWQDRPFHPYGIAEFDLSELLLGEKIIELISPIQDCHQIDVNTTLSNGLRPSLVSRAVAKSVHKPAHYLESGSELKIKIELAMPLVCRGDFENTPPAVQHEKLAPMSSTKGISSSTSLVLAASGLSEECPFSRIVYVFDYSNKPFLASLLNLVNTINALALELAHFPQHVIDAALSTYKLSTEQRDSRSLDIITGFQIIDGRHHILVLEGLFSQGISRLWNQLERPEPAADQTFRTLYNSEMTFSQRIYNSLDVDLTRIRLYQPLEQIVKHPLLYVRDMIPKLSFEGVSKLYQLSSCETLHNAIRNELLPTAPMLIAMSKEFGIPLTEEDFDDPVGEENMNVISTEEATTTVYLSEDSKHTSPVKRTSSSMEQHKVGFRTSRPWTPLQINNPRFKAILRERQENEENTPTHDYVYENATSIPSHQRRRHKKQRSITCDVAALEGSPGSHNYSTQAMNTTELAQAQLRALMAEDPTARFTYCQDYNSATLVPVDVKHLSQEQAEHSKARRKTTNGFVYPGMKTALESNVAPNKPDPARLDELEKPWRENVLHGNELKPTVDRIFYSWSDRDIDFNTWKAPPEYFGKKAPVTIHAAGDTLKQEQHAVDEAEESDWQRKLIIDDPQLRMHRCLAGTEMTVRGLKASNQLARLEDILKGSPRKHTLSAPGLLLNPIPGLSVVSYPNVDTHKRDIGILKPVHTDYKQLERNCGYQPGAFPDRSWSLDKNKIPLTTYQQEQFGDMHPHNFRLVYKERSKLSTRPISELTDMERTGNHLFPLGSEIDRKFHPGQKLSQDNNPLPALVS